MLQEEFNIFWENNFEETIPLNFLFRDVYKNRWLRIHSLPESKRYADDDNEMDTILFRQNQLISDEYSENEDIYIVSVEFSIDNEEGDEEFCFYPEYNFEKTSVLNLNTYFPLDFSSTQKLKIFVSKRKWRVNFHNNILKDIANDASIIFFVSIRNKIIFAPYDGGMDVIYQNENQKNFYKEKYIDWLSERTDEL